MLVGAGGGDLGFRPVFHLRQPAAFFVISIVTAFFVDREVTVEQDHLAGGAQAGLAVGAFQLDGGALDPGGFHL